MSVREPIEGRQGGPLSVDDLVEIANRTVLSVYGAWALLLAVVYHSRSVHGGLSLTLLGWAVVVNIWRAIRFVDARLMRSAPLEPMNDIVLVTGASRGLGLLVTAFFSEKGYRIVALDLSPLPIALTGCTYFETDISDEHAVANSLEKAAAVVGHPTVVVNCAGIMRSGKISDTPSTDIAQVFGTNLFGGLWVIRAALPWMLQHRRGFIVNVSSSTALVGPAGAGIYAASKAAVRTCHQVLEQELRGTGVNTLLVCPGQLDTPMFSSIETPNKFAAPVVSAPALAEQIVGRVVGGQGGEILTPAYAQWAQLVDAVLPRFVLNMARKQLGIDAAMETFTVR